VLITDSFIYIHMPKTGGTFVETVLRRVLEAVGERYTDTATAAGRARLSARDQHGTLAEVPAEHRGKQVLATARNPFDHLASFFEFGWWRDHPNDTFNEAVIRARYSQYPDLSFDQYLEAIYDWQTLARGYIEPEQEQILQAADVGPSTFDYFRYLAQEPVETISSLAAVDVEDALMAATKDVRYLRCESLNQELSEFLLESGYSKRSTRFVLDLEPIRPYGSTRVRDCPWQDYFTEPLKRRVRRRERAIFSLFPEYDV
jgi:hypothetical protein